MGVNGECHFIAKPVWRKEKMTRKSLKEENKDIKIQKMILKSQRLNNVMEFYI